MDDAASLLDSPAQRDQPRRTGKVGQTERLLSLLGGGALALFGLSRRSRGGAALAAAGAYAVYRGLSGHCWLYQMLGLDMSRSRPGMAGPDLASGRVSVARTVTIARPRQEVYRFWRRLETLPRFMQHLESVTVLDERRSRWVARAPLGRTITWEAEITEDGPDELIAWRSLEGAPVETSGRVQFADAPGGRGTEARVRLDYRPPGGLAGALAAKLLGEEPTQQVHDDLRHLKQMLETGEVATVAGQPSGRERPPARSDAPAPPARTEPSAWATSGQSEPAAPLEGAEPGLGQ